MNMAVKRRALFIVIAIALLLSIFTPSVFAQYRTPRGKAGTEVQAAVGELYLNISGFASPYASIVLTTLDGIFLRSSVADSYGKFYISQVLISKGLTGFCLTTIDFKRLGESTTCIKFPPATNNITMDNLFLPPTLGLFRKVINAGGTAIAFGYTMPGALVTLHLDNGMTLTTRADSTGFYKFEIKNLKAGTYKLFSTAEYKNQESLLPTKKVELKALSIGEQAVTKLSDFWKDLLRRLTELGLGLLWLALFLIILIIILLIKLFWARIKGWFFIIFGKKRRKRDEEETQGETG